MQVKARYMHEKKTTETGPLTHQLKVEKHIINAAKSHPHI